MAVKSTIKEPIGNEDKISYPIIMQSKCTGDVVLFISEAEGVVVGAGFSEVGEFDSGWTSSKDSETWKLFNGKLILENK